MSESLSDSDESGGYTHGGRSSGTTLSRLRACGPEEPEQAPPSPDYVPDDDIGSIDADGGGGDMRGIVEVDEEAGEEHPAPAYPVDVALPATAPSAEETEPFETDESAATPPPHPAYRMTARITILEPLPFQRMKPFPLSPPSPVLTAPPPSPIRSLGYRAVTIQMRAEAAATSHSLPLPPPFILSPTRPDAPPPMPTTQSTGALTSLPPIRRELVAAAARPARALRADYGFVATMDREIRHDPERYVGYGITDSWDEIVETLQGAPIVPEQIGSIRCLETRRVHAQTLHFDGDWRLDGLRGIGDDLLIRVNLAPSRERDDSTSGTGHHTARAGNSFTRIGDGIAGAGYCITGTAGTRWGSCTARAARGGWKQS
ncbi:hypothetical protein Tco_0662794 [Tanacetum coccineum]